MRLFAGHIPSVCFHPKSGATLFHFNLQKSLFFYNPDANWNSNMYCKHILFISKTVSSQNTGLIFVHAPWVWRSELQTHTEINLLALNMPQHFFVFLFFLWLFWWVENTSTLTSNPHICQGDMDPANLYQDSLRSSSTIIPNIRSLDRGGSTTSISSCLTNLSNPL